MFESDRLSNFRNNNSTPERNTVAKRLGENKELLQGATITDSHGGGTEVFILRLVTGLSVL